MVSVSKNERSKYLTDVVIIRLSLIFLLVFYHSFAIYSGNWSSPFFFPLDIPVYYWLSVCSHGFRLEAMTFISGLLLGYTVKRYPERMSFNGCVIKKIKRILLPCILFSAIYFFIFSEANMTWYESVYEIMIGCGHLWYLPMVFWCFVLIFIIETYTTTSVKVLLSITFLLSLLPLQGFLPLRLGYTINFFIYFYIGYLIMKHDVTEKIKISAFYCVLGILIYFLIGILLKEWIMELNPSSLMMHGIQILLMRASHLTGALAMILAFYGISNFAYVSGYIAKHPRFIKLSGYCYGVYIYQQFILLLLYFHTNMPIILGPVALPWVACIITICLSLLMCHLTLKTRLGKFLIG
ncbi:acyltransferase family protein [Bacteroides sp.]